MANDYTVPPSDLAIERCVLGAMLFEEEAIDIAIEELTQESFYKPANGIIFEAIKNLRISGSPADQLTITEELRKQGMLDKIGGKTVIASISGEITSAANIKSHISILNEKASKRKLISITTAFKAMCYEDNSESEEIASQLYMQAVAILDKKKETPYRTMATIIRDAYDWIIKKAHQTGTMGISTGLSRLDKFIDGWQDGNLYIVAGKTSKGKSALATNSFALNAAKAGIPTGLFSLEMSDIQIGVRIISKEAKMDLSGVQYQPPTQVQWEEISAACNRINTLPLVIDETPGMSIAQIGSRIRKMQRDKNIKLVIVDYLQLMEGKKTNSREQEVASISRGLKLLAKSLHIPIIALSQLSRKADESDIAEPQLSFLRESGALEMDSDTVIFIHDACDKVKQDYPINGDKQNIRELIIAKNRGGKTGKLFVLWKPELVSFFDIEY